MAENLNYDVSGSKCYGDSTSNCNKYGRLYDWATAMGISAFYNTNSYNPPTNTKYRGICPSGWHLPSDAEWDALLTMAGYSRNLVATSGWAYNNGTDDYGFSALPGGNYSNNSGFTDVGKQTDWWSATEVNYYGAYRWNIHASALGAILLPSVKDFFISVRCVKD